MFYAKFVFSCQWLYLSLFCLWIDQPEETSDAKIEESSDAKIEESKGGIKESKSPSPEPENSKENINIIFIGHVGML